MANDIADLFRDVEQFQREVVGWKGVNNTAAERKLCVKLIAEELAEYDSACESGDRLATLHEAVDLVYVCVGLSVRLNEKAEWVAKSADARECAKNPDGHVQAGYDLASWMIAKSNLAVSPWDIHQISVFVACHEAFYEAWDRIHTANMRKKDGPVIDGKKCKPEGWQPADLSDLVDTMKGMQCDA